HAVDKLNAYFPNMGQAWTKEGQLPGGNLEGYDRDGYSRLIRQRHPWLPEALALRFARTYGSNTEVLLEGITDLAGMGEN
ncbi:glycerol-3-phosphate dehydrogenase, partial [Escherichia coli]